MAETILAACPYEQVSGPFALAYRAAVHQVPADDGVTIRIVSEISGVDVAPSPNLLTVEITHPTAFSDSYLAAIESLDDTVILSGPEE